MATLINRNRGCFPSADNRAFNWAREFRQKFGASEISENLWSACSRRISRAMVMEKHVNEGGGRLVYPRLSAAPDARSTLPAGCGNQPSRNCWASSSRTKLYPSWRTCNNDGIPLSHRGGSLLGSSFFDIIGLWHREDPRQRARLQIGGHSRRRTLDTLCMSLGWQSGPDTRHRSSGLFAAKTEPRKFRSGKDRRGRSTTRLLPPTFEHGVKYEFNFGQHSPRSDRFRYFSPPFELGLGKTRNSNFRSNSARKRYSVCGMDPRLSGNNFHVDYKGKSILYKFHFIQRLHESYGNVYI